MVHEWQLDSPHGRPCSAIRPTRITVSGERQEASLGSDLHDDGQHRDLIVVRCIVADHEPGPVIALEINPGGVKVQSQNAGAAGRYGAGGWAGRDELSGAGQAELIDLRVPVPAGRGEAEPKTHIGFVGVAGQVAADQSARTLAAMFRADPGLQRIPTSAAIRTDIEIQPTLAQRAKTEHVRSIRVARPHSSPAAG